MNEPGGPCSESEGTNGVEEEPVGPGKERGRNMRMERSVQVQSEEEGVVTFRKGSRVAGSRMGVVTRKGQEVERKFSSSTRDLSVPRRRECRGRRVRGHHILGCNRGRLSAETRGEFTLGRLRARLRRAVPKTFPLTRS